MSAQDLVALDAYLAALESMDNVVGERARAVAAAERAGLPPLEWALAGAAVQAAHNGQTARAFLVDRLPLTQEPASPHSPYSNAGNRLYQAIANLRAVDLWPWAE